MYVFEYKQKEVNSRDSIFRADRQQQIIELETKFKTQIKENENDALRKDIALNNLEIERQNQIRNFLIALSLLVFSLVFVLLNRALIFHVPVCFMPPIAAWLKTPNNGLSTVLKGGMYCAWAWLKC